MHAKSAVFSRVRGSFTGRHDEHETLSTPVLAVVARVVGRPREKSLECKHNHQDFQVEVRHPHFYRHRKPLFRNVYDMLLDGMLILIRIRLETLADDVVLYLLIPAQR